MDKNNNNNDVSEVTNQQKKASSSRRWISYMTDVEGDREYLHRYVEQSKVLCWRPYHPDNDTPIHPVQFDFPYDQCIDFQETIQDNAILVFGGDVWDQGGSDLYVIRQLMYLKQRYPDQVYFVLGNRDLNKLRIIQELGKSDEQLGCHHGVYILKGTERIGDPNLGPLPFTTSTERLQWMLGNTMGSPRAFEYRRDELLELRNNMGQYDPVRDEDVVQSYRQSCDPETGELAHYLEAGCLVLRLGEVAFVHGALPLTSHNVWLPDTDDDMASLWDDLSFAMPWLDPGLTSKDVGVEKIDDWMKALNHFCSQNVQAWRDCGGESDGMWSQIGGYHQSKQAQPYGQLLQYGMGSLPDRIPNPTVVYNSWGSNSRVAGAPRKFFQHDAASDFDVRYVKHTQEFLQRTGIRLICSGHQPAGELPNHIRIEYDGDDRTGWILCCDTSYTGDTMWFNSPHDPHPPRVNLGRGDAKSGRGKVAVSEVLIEQCVDTGAILEAYCHGTLSDGTSYSSHSLDFGTTSTGKSISAASGLVTGTLASGDLVPNLSDSPHGGPWWTQASLRDGSTLLAAAEGFRFWTRAVWP